jgi:hypothetical protein
MSNIDFEKDQTDVLSHTKDINRLATKVKDLQTLENEIDALKDRIKNTKRDLEILSGDVIPTMMAEMGLTQLKLMDGSSVDVKQYYGASLGQGRSESDSDFIKRKEAAYKWLRSNGLGDIIKNEVSVSFGMNEDNKAVDYANLAQSQGYQPTQKLKVEPMTLKALVRERIEKGVEMPMDIFNVFVGNRTKLTRKQ